MLRVVGPEFERDAVVWKHVEIERLTEERKLPNGKTTWYGDWHYCRWCRISGNKCGGYAKWPVQSVSKSH